MIRILNVPSLHSSLYSVIKFCEENKNEKIDIIVPDKLSLFMEKFLFEKMNITASFNLRVNTLNRFAKKNISIDKTKQISKIGSILLINKILNDNIEKFQIFSSKAYSFSYAENIFRTIGQLKASKILPEELLTFKSEDIQLSKKIADLAIVYDEYEKGKAGLIDASDMFLMSAFQIAKQNIDSKILLVGFDDFTAIEYSIIEQLAKNAEVNIYNFNGKNYNKHIYNYEVVDQLKHIAYINDLPFEVVDVDIQTSKFKDFLSNNLFATKHEEFCLRDDSIKIQTAKSVEEEIELVVRDIRNKILKGAQYNNFGVAVYGLENYENKIQEIFSKYEINYYFDSEIPINKSVLYKFINSLLKYNLEGYSLSNLIDIINSPFFEIEEVDKKNLISKLLDVGFAGKIKENFGLYDENLEVQDKLISFASLINLDRQLNVCDIIEKLKNVFDSLKVDEKIQMLINSIGNAENSIILTKSKQLILDFFEDFLKFNPNADLEAFYDVYSHIPAVLKVNNLPLCLDCVKVVDANNNMEVFNNLYIVNCTKENAPNFKFDCGILLDNEIEKMNFSHKLSPTIAHINKLSRLRLFNLLSMFENSLILSYSQNASDIIKELCQKIYILDGSKKIYLMPLNILPLENQILSKWDYITQVCKNNVKLDEVDENLIKNKDFSQISKENSKIYNNFETISASQLENYFKCPFYMFLNNILKIRPRLDNEILSFDVGNVLHEIMYKYYKYNKKVGDIYQFCKNEVFNFIEEDKRLKLKLDSPILINLIDEAVRVIEGLNYIDDNSTFIPYKFEHGFFETSALKLRNVDIVGKVDRIDKSGDMLRVVDYKSGKADASLKELYYGNKLQLFLYACAVESELNKKVIGGFYLPLHNKYAREIKSNYSLNGYFINEDFVIQALDKNVVAGEKSDIVDMRLTKDFKAYGMPQNNQMEDLKNYSKKISEQAVDEIKSGFIKPAPIDYAKFCEYCPYSQTCLSSSQKFDARKTKSVKLSSFEEDGNG